MAVLDGKARAVLHVLAFLFFRMGATERAGRVYAALAALPPPYPGNWGMENTENTESRRGCDAQALLGLAAVALERGDAEQALAHLRFLLRHLAHGGEWRGAALAAAAHLLRAQALRAVGRLEESAAAAQLYQEIAERTHEQLAVTGEGGQR